MPGGALEETRVSEKLRKPSQGIKSPEGFGFPADCPSKSLMSSEAASFHFHADKSGAPDSADSPAGPAALEFATGERFLTESVVPMHHWSGLVDPEELP